MADSAGTPFADAHALAERLFTMQTKQADQMMEKLTHQGRILTALAVDMATVKGRADQLPDLSKRVTKLEAWKAFVAGIAAAFTMIGGSIGWVIGILVRR